jgi:hypothetical protein
MLSSNSRAAIAHALRASHKCRVSLGRTHPPHLICLAFMPTQLERYSPWNKVESNKKKSNPTFLSWRDCHFGYVGYNCPGQ